MRTFEKVKGAPIFFSKTKRKMGNITDLVVSHEGAKVKGYWVQTKRWWSKKRYLSLERVVHDGGDGIFAESGKEMEVIPKENSRFCDGKNHLLGKIIQKQDGTVIGLIEDVYFLPDTGMIVGYELTEGLFSDFKKGVKVIKPKTPLEIKGESFIVRTES